MQGLTDTIYALSSGSLPSGVAVIRVSGSAVREIAEGMISRVPKARDATLAWIRNRDGEKIDECLVLYFEGPRSFTGQDCLELHCHGGPAVVKAILRDLSRYEDCRAAEAGEFTQRAFTAGKVDLVEVEGLADLLSAETEMQRQMAIHQAEGHLSRMFHAWANQLTRARAMIEADLDFADEDDVPGSVADLVQPIVRSTRVEMQEYLDGVSGAEIIRDGFEVVIAGPPNAGKSSLINYLSRKDLAIVTDIPGTTRDSLSVDLNMGGYLVRLTDTAGLRESEDVVEQEGVRRSRNRIADADLVLSLAAADQEFEAIDNAAKPIRIRTKSDMGTDGEDFDLAISTRDGDGMDELRTRILHEVRHRTQNAGRSNARLRQVGHIQNAVLVLGAIEDRGDKPLELLAETLRQAAGHLGKVTGKTDTEDLLDVIFSEFCIGK